MPDNLVDITQGMRQRILNARKQISLKLLSEMLSSAASTIGGVSSGKRKKISGELAQRILALEVREPPARMDYEHFRRECRTGAFLELLRTCCTNYTQLEAKIKKEESKIK